MSNLKILLLGFFMFLLVAVHAQDYFYESEELEPNVRIRRDVNGFMLERNNEEDGRHLRFRRQGDDENQRFRRQGGHGGGGNGGGHEGVTGPVHTFVKTDEHAHFKWGVRHHVGHEYAGRR